MSSPFSKPVTRRSVLRIAGIGAGSLLVGSVLAACSDDGAPAGSSAASSSGGDLGAFDPDVEAGPATGLDRRVVFANITDAAFFLALSDNVQAAAESRGMEFATTIANSNPQTYVQQIEQYIARGVGAMVVTTLDDASQRSPQLAAIDAGIGLFGLVTTPSTCVAVTDQYAVGQAQGRAAVDYITQSLGGRARVLYMNTDSQGAELVKRHQGVTDALTEGGSGIEIVLDVEPDAVSVEAGFATASTALQAHPDINVVLSGDSQTVGAYQAFDQAGALTQDMYFGGIDGDPQALALIAEGGAYRTSHGFAWPILGYVTGQYACDWIEGRSIPRALVVPPVQLTADSLDAYNADMARPAEVFAEQSLLATYIDRRGNVDYQTRDEFWNSSYTPN